MNRIEANPSNFASPAAPFGLETAGRNPLFSKIRNLKVQTLSLVAMASAIACGGEPKADASTPSSTVLPSTPIAAEDSRASISTTISPQVEAVNIETKSPSQPSGLSEESKTRIRDESPVKLTAISSEISAIQRPSNASITPEGLSQVQSAINSDVNMAKEAFVKGNVDEAREALLRVSKNIRNLQKSGNTVVIPKEVKAQHDPADKYVNGVLVLDSGLFDYYFGVIDILVRLDKQ